MKRSHLLCLFILLILFVSTAAKAQDPHEAPETVIAAECFYHALENGNHPRALIELHNEITFNQIQISKEKALQNIVSEFNTKNKSVKFSTIEYVPIENDQILVTGFYHSDKNAKAVYFEHLWSLKNRKFIKFENSNSKPLADIEKK